MQQHLFDNNPFVPVRVYIGNTWSYLNATERGQMRGLVNSLAKTATSHGLRPFASLNRVPPGLRSGDEAAELWFKLRKEMGRSHLFLMVNAGPSDGMCAELQNADDNRVPAVVMQKEGSVYSELSHTPSVEILHMFHYGSKDQAVEYWDDFLEGSKLQLQRAAIELSNWRATIAAMLSIGTTVKWLRKKRGLSVEELAKRARISPREVYAIETDLGYYAPPVTHLAAVALALQTTFADLCLSPSEWLRRYTDMLVTQVAMGQNLSVPLINEFRLSVEMRLDPDHWPTERSVQLEIETWLQSKFAGIRDRG